MLRHARWEGLWQHPVASWESLDWSDGQAVGQIRIAAVERQLPCQLDYRLEWDADWRLRRAWLRRENEHSSGELTLDSDGQGHWQRDGEALAELDGCLDLDLWPSPFTNTLPIRRLHLAPGAQAALDVVYLQAADLRPQRMRQGYECLDARHYRYRNLDGSGFEAVLEVDEHGLVLDYPGLFRRR
ncbi:MAG: hypothetical protein GAK43_01667 [Stenotrophomonas maltophilia]|nr:MAG: hypothetical protein GAK43_01667 [Stenotrophomonas maltophilia]